MDSKFLISLMSDKNPSNYMTMQLAEASMRINSLLANLREKQMMRNFHLLFMGISESIKSNQLKASNPKYLISKVAGENSRKFNKHKLQKFLWVPVHSLLGKWQEPSPATRSLPHSSILSFASFLWLIHSLFCFPLVPQPLQNMSENKALNKIALIH